MTRGVFFDEVHARATVARLLDDGFRATFERARFAGEDDDEGHPWAVSTDAPGVVLELLVEEYDGWLESSDPTPKIEPLELPDAPKRAGRER